MVRRTSSTPRPTRTSRSSTKRRPSATRTRPPSGRRWSWTSRTEAARRRVKRSATRPEDLAIGNRWTGPSDVHEALVVAGVEAITGRVGDAVHGRLEAGDRIPGALGVGVVRREEEQIVAALVDQPADVLARERGERQLPVHVVRGPLGQRLQRLLAATEARLADVEPAQPWHHPHRTLLDAPALQARMGGEHAVE